MRGAAPLCLQRGIPTLGTLVTTQELHTDTAGASAFERPDHFCLAPHVAMGVGLYLHPGTLYSSGNWSDREPRAPRAVSEDPASISAMLLERCSPLAFMPEARCTRHSNPDLVRCSFRRIDRTMAADERKSSPFTTGGIPRKTEGPLPRGPAAPRP